MGPRPLSTALAIRVVHHGDLRQRSIAALRALAADISPVQDHDGWAKSTRLAKRWMPIRIAISTHISARVPTSPSKS
jgi:hypothetical protein